MAVFTMKGIEEAMMSVIALDLGGTKLAAAIFSGGGEMVHKEVVPLHDRQGHDVGLLIVEQIRRAMSMAEPDIGHIEAVGVSVPGIYYADTGRVWAPNIPGWQNYPLLEEISSLFSIQKVKVRIESDRACYILGETWQGAARGCKDAIFIAVGTGIGAGIMMNGEIVRGHNDIAGAIGWLALDRPYRDEYTACGCFEYNASGEGIARVAQDLLARDREYSGILRKKNLASLSSHDLFDAYAAHDPLAELVFDNCCAYWGMALANLVSLFNPEKIIFGGGVFGPAAQFLDRIIGEARHWAQPISMTKVTVEVSTLGGDAGLIGAGRLALLAMHRS